MYPKDCVRCGKLRKLHGRKGALKVSFQHQSNHITGQPYWLIETEPGLELVPFFVDTCRPVSDREAIVHFEDVETPESAREMIGSSVYMEPRKIEVTPGKDPGATDLLKGYRVTDATHGDIGTVAEVIEREGQELLSITHPSGNEVLLPVNENIIVEINQEDKNMKVEMPGGLLELYI